MEIPNHLSANFESPHWSFIATNEKLKVSFNDERQHHVIEYNISEGWLIRPVFNEKGGFKVENNDFVDEKVYGVVKVWLEL